MKIIKWLTISILIIGVLGLAFNQLFSDSVTFLTNQYESTSGLNTIDNIYIYDFNKWWQNITYVANFDNTSLKIELPIDQTGIIRDVINYLILIINLILYPLKIAIFGIRLLLALIGLPFNPPTGLFAWLGDLFNILLNSETNNGMIIPYIY